MITPKMVRTELLMVQISKASIVNLAQNAYKNVLKMVLLDITTMMVLQCKLKCHLINMKMLYVLCKTE